MPRHSRGRRSVKSSNASRTRSTGTRVSRSICTLGIARSLRLVACRSRVPAAPGPGHEADALCFERVEQAVLHGEDGGGGPRGHAGLAVDGLDVVARRLRRDHEVAGDVPGGYAAGQQPQHLHLAGGERAGVPLAPAHPMPRRREHRVDRVAVQPSGPDLAVQLRRGPVGGQRGPVRARFAHRWNTSSVSAPCFMYSWMPKLWIARPRCIAAAMPTGEMSVGPCMPDLIWYCAAAVARPGRLTPAARPGGGLSDRGL